MFSETDKYFLTIAKAGSLNKASQLLYVSQPSLTKYVKRIEDKLGTQLFDRTKIPMKLTYAGIIYLHYIQKQYENEIILQDELIQIKEMKQGVLRLGIPPFYGKYFLPRILPNFVHIYPQIKLEIMEDKGATLDKALLSGEINIAIHHLPVSSHKLTYQNLQSEKILFLTPQTDSLSFPFQPVTKTTLEQFFQTKKFILPQKGQKIYGLIEEYLSRCNFLPNDIIRINDMGTIIALIASGIGVGFVPELGLESISREYSSKINSYVLEDMNPYWQIVSVRRKESPICTFEKDFIEMAKQILNCNSLKK